MNYKIIDKEKYYRSGVYRHFTEDCKCSTSMTARIDVTDQDFPVSAMAYEECFPDVKKISRYAIKKNTEFDIDLLHKLMDKLPKGYEIKNIDENIYDLCLTDSVTRDFVSSFETVIQNKNFSR